MALTKKSSKKTILSTWLAALRGQGAKKYKQGASRLHIAGAGQKADTFCCLGVLCDLAVQAKVIPAPIVVNNDDWYGQVYSYNKKAEALPKAVRTWAGITSPLGDFKDANGDSTTLASLNDGGTSFKKIANIIEKKPKGLFV